MSAFSNILKIPELRRRLLFTLAMVAVYRLGIFVSTPGVDRSVMADMMAQGGASFLGMFNMFSGGAFENLSIFALNIMPYVSASIIISLMSIVFKPLEEMRKEGEAGQRKINQYTRYGTIVLAIVQGTFIALWLEQQNSSGGVTGDVVLHPGWAFRALTVLTLTTGTAFLMWLGEQITERGVGNGISVLIFTGIVANIPSALQQTGHLVQNDTITPIRLMMIVVAGLAIIGFIVFFERAQRQVPIQYAKRVVGGKVYGGNTNSLPIKPNMSGVVPPIFASSLLMFPGTLANLELPGMTWLQSQLSPGSWGYNTMFLGLTIFFAFFYTAITFQPVDVAENLRRQSAFIPGVRPGKDTANYLDDLVTKLTVGGAIYLAVVCTIPTLLQSEWNVPFYFGGTSLIIVVGVALDLAQAIESHLITHHYEGIMGDGGPRIRGRKG
jgi:preprotein translocase subunit SecY